MFFGLVVGFWTTSGGVLVVDFDVFDFKLVVGCFGGFGGFDLSLVWLFDGCC